MKSLTLEQIDKILVKSFVALPENFLKININSTDSICLKHSKTSIQKAKCGSSDSCAYCFYTTLMNKFEAELAETDFLQSIEGTIKDCKEKVHKNNLRRPDNKMKGHE